MDHKNDFERHRRVLTCLGSLPRKIMAVHELDNVPEFIVDDEKLENTEPTDIAALAALFAAGAVHQL